MMCRCGDVIEMWDGEAKSYADEHLEEIEVRAGGWEVVYECHLTGERWLEDCPRSGEHGGGPMRLRQLSDRPEYEWDEIHGFESPREFRRFQRCIDRAIEEGALRSVALEERYGDAAFDEWWYAEPSGSIWRLVAPEAPFRGVFLRVRWSNLGA